MHMFLGTLSHHKTLFICLDAFITHSVSYLLQPPRGTVSLWLSCRSLRWWCCCLPQLVAICPSKKQSIYPQWFFFVLSISSIWTCGYNTLEDTYFYFFDQSVLLLVIRLRKLINLYFMFLDFPHDLSGGKKAVKSFWQTRKWLNKKYNVRVSFVMCLFRGRFILVTVTFCGGGGIPSRWVLSCLWHQLHL